jgi:hypothetical protein
VWENLGGTRDGEGTEKEGKGRWIRPRDAGPVGLVGLDRIRETESATVFYGFLWSSFVNGFAMKA